MGGGEFLHGLYISELGRRSFSSPERLVGILGSIVELSNYAEAARRLRAAACDVAALADAAMVLARPGPENGPDSL